MSTKRFRIAFSFTGERRKFVAAVAGLLAARFDQEQILYDHYHEAEFARRDLGIRLPALYHDESELIVVVICPDYDKKQWTGGLEWPAIYDLLSLRRDEGVMLCRFKSAQVAGLYSTAGFVDLDQKTPRQAADLILQRLALNEGLPKDHYLTPSSGSKRAAIPNNLPRLEMFFGREKELAKLAESLAEDARGWGALIDGPGGIGKTSLAIRAAEDVPAGRFRRIVFLSAKERELSADGQRALGGFVLPGYLEMLNAIARELGQPDLAKSVEDQRAEVVLRALRDQEVLLLLDNLETLPTSDRDQLFAFLNRLPRGCSAIVTSRRRADASAVTVRLDRLEWDAAAQMLAELARHNDRLQAASTDERRRLYEETGGNPLLLRWVAGQLGLGRCRDIAAALDFLRRAPSGNDPLEYIFGDLLGSLTANEIRVLAALAHFSTLMETTFIAELAGLHLAAATGALEDLAFRALVVPDNENRRYGLVAMVADFVRRARPEVVRETGQRLEDYAYALIVENGYDEYDRFPALDTAWPTLAPALPLFIAGPNKRLQTVCSALAGFLNFTGRLDERLWLSQQAEIKALAAGDILNAGWRAYQIGWISYLRQQAETVLDCAERATTYWQTAGEHERASAIRLRGIGYELQKDYPAAIAAYREALELWRSLSAESEGMATVLNDLAEIERFSDDYAAAERDYREALQIARAVNDAEGVATYTGNLAELALDRQNWPQAEQLAREALELAEKIGSLELIASDCWRITKALVRQNQPAPALPYAQRAVEIFTRLGLPDIKYVRATLDECEQQLAAQSSPDH